MGERHSKNRDEREEIGDILGRSSGRRKHVRIQGGGPYSLIASGELRRLRNSRNAAVLSELGRFTRVRYSTDTVERSRWRAPRAVRYAGTMNKALHPRKNPDPFGKILALGH